jgi:hypothetical protein
MKKFLRLSLQLIVLILCMGSSCNKKDAPPPNPYINGGGGHEFWSSALNCKYPIALVVRDASNNIIHASSIEHDTIFKPLTGDPNCTEHLGIVQYVDTAGNYSFTATSRDGTSWSGTFTIYAGLCHTEELNGSCFIPVGTWLRTVNGSQGNSANLRIYWNGTTGVVTDNPGNSCLKVGMTVWQNCDSKGCTIQTLSTNADCSNPFFNSSSIQWDIAHPYTQVTIGGIDYLKL